MSVAVAKKVVIRTQVDQKLKEDTEVILGSLGLTMDSAVKLFLMEVQHNQALPFKLPRRKQDNSDILFPAAVRQKALNSVYED